MPRRLRILAATVAGLAAAAGAPAQAAIPPTPIPEGPGANQLPQFIGSPATPNPVFAPATPQNPFMAQNGKSNVHDDAYMSDTYTWSGPLGRHMDRASTFQAAECGTLTLVADWLRTCRVCLARFSPAQLTRRIWFWAAVPLVLPAPR